MTVTEVIENLAAGKLSLDDVRADFANRTWRVKPTASSETDARRISDNWIPDGSSDEIAHACAANGVLGADKAALYAAYRESPNKLKLTIEQLESGDDPAQNPAAAGGGGDADEGEGEGGEAENDDDEAKRLLDDEDAAPDEADEAEDDDEPPKR